MQDTKIRNSPIRITAPKCVAPNTWDSHFSRTLHYAMLAVGVALVAGSALVAQAQTAAEVPAAGSVVAASPTAALQRSAAVTPELTIRDVYDRLAAQGYRDFREIEWEHGRYEVKAQSAQGRPVKVYVDGRSGMVLGLRTHHE